MVKILQFLGCWLCDLGVGNRFGVMKVIGLMLGLLICSVSYSVELPDAEYHCDDESMLKLHQMKAKFHDVSKVEKEINGLSILNSGKAIKLDFDNKTSVLCHKSKAEILFL